MLGDVIPQVFHDILARAMPGASVILLAIACWCGPVETFAFAQANREWLFGFGPLCIAILASYIFGVLLTEIWRAAIDRWRKATDQRIERGRKAAIFREHQRVCRKARRVKKTDALKLDDLPSIYVMHDHVRQVNAADGARLLKLGSERAASRALVVGLAICLLIDAVQFYFATEGKVARLIAGVVMVLSAVVFCLRERRLWTFFVHGTVTAWLALYESKQLEIRKLSSEPRNGTQDTNP